MNCIENIGIEIVSGCVPRNIITNRDLNRNSVMSEKEFSKFERITGIKERRYVDPNVTASDLGFSCVENIFKNTNLKRDEIGTLIWVSQTSDYIIPFTSNILQDRLKLNSNTFCLDINAGCAGFIQGLYTAYLMAQNSDKKVLLILGETLSKIISSSDRATTPIFGDGSAALVISKTNSEVTSYFEFYSDGKYYDKIIIPDGGFRNILDQESFMSVANEKSKNKLHMDGSAVFDFTMREIPFSIINFLNDLNISNEEISYFAAHQSNKFIINQIAQKTNLTKEKILINIDKFGNTSGVSIPLLLVTNKDNYTPNSNLLCTGYGSGLNWGNCLISLKETEVLELIEI